MGMQNAIFKDDATGMAMLSAELPDTFQCRAQFKVVQDGEGDPRILIQGAALDGDNHIELYFKSGENYNVNPPQGVNTNVRYHAYCDASVQLDEAAAEFIGQSIPAVNKFNLPEARMEHLQRTGNVQIEQGLGIMRQVGSFSQVPVNVQCTGVILDGGMGIYPFIMKDEKKTLYTAIWRIGFAATVSMAGGFSAMMPAQNYCSWNVPMVINMVTDGGPSPENMGIFAGFINTLKDFPEFEAYVKQLNDQVINNSLNKSAQSARQNQAMWAQANAQQEAAWARSRALSKQLSADMDSFRAGLAANSASMDAFRDNLSSMNSTSSGFGTSFEGGESLDDRIQRGRHEAMMGVNTYVKEDGTEYEHTIMNDRVFESNLDNNQHFGTENYFGDYVPDGWHEIYKK